MRPYKLRPFFLVQIDASAKALEDAQTQLMIREESSVPRQALACPVRQRTVFRH